MKAITKIIPSTQAILPARIESAPSPGPTVRSSRMVSGAGSAPARSSKARSCTSCTLKRPEMMPLPPKIAERITGALITWPSSTMANGLPMLFFVTSPKRLPPTESNLKKTTGRASSKVGWASTSVSPVTMTRLRMTY